MFRLLALALSALSLFGQNPARSADDELGRATRNPYDLASFISSHPNFQWAPLWKALHVADPPDIGGCDEQPNRLCSVDLITLFKPSQVILAIAGMPSDTYLRFLQDSSGWRYSGSHNTYRKNFAEKHQISRIGGKPFLRVSQQGASASNWDSEVEQWLDLSRPEFVPVFAFTVQGNENRMGFGVSRRVHAYAVPGPDHSPETLSVHLEVWYTMHYDRPLGFAKYDAVYERTAKQTRFSLREANPSLGNGPELAKKEFEELANIDVDGGPSNEQLLVYALPGLKEIASGSNGEEKGWLRSVLSYCKDTPAKRILQALLDAKR